MSHSRASQQIRRGTADITANIKGRKTRANKRFNLLSGLVLVSAMSLGLSGSWARDKDDNVSYTKIRRAECRPSDNPETGLQGQIPMPDRLAGFKGFNCNLSETAATSASRSDGRGDGLFQQFAYVHDRAGHLCGYGGGVFFTRNPGTVVVDLTDPNHSVQTDLLTTPAMLGPGEGLRAHEGRGLLVSGNYRTDPVTSNNAANGFDVYDVGADCRHPQLLVSTTTLEIDTTGLVPDPAKGAWPNPDKIYGHEGAFAPDGMTYYVGDWPHSLYHAIDLTNPSKPQILASFANPFLSKPSALDLSGGVHGLSLSNDGKRAYVTSLYRASGPKFASGGFVIFDTSEIQERKPNPHPAVVSESYWNDGSFQQTTIPVKIGGKPYLIITDEGGSGQTYDDLRPPKGARGQRAACAANMPPFGMIRIHDIEDEKHPKVVAKLLLEVNDPTNCSLVDPEIGGVNGFLYDAHMCTVDNRDDATTLACAYFESGIRVYDIRDPSHVKEIAYFNPPAKTAGVDGSTSSGGPGWCAAMPFLDASSGMLYTSCASTGVISLKFSKDVWPFQNSKSPRDKQL